MDPLINADVDFVVCTLLLTVHLPQNLRSMIFMILYIIWYKFAALACKELICDSDLAFFEPKCDHGIRNHKVALLLSFKAKVSFIDAYLILFEID